MVEDQIDGQISLSGTTVSFQLWHRMKSQKQTCDRCLQTSGALGSGMTCLSVAF